MLPPAPAPAPARRPPKQEQEPASDAVTEVAPGVLRMQLPIWMPGLGHVNMYGLVDDRGLAVVDPGLPGPQSWKALKARLASAGFRLRDVHTVVVTHSHPDHFGAAGRIRREAGAQVIAHRAFTTWALGRRRATLSETEAEELERDAIEAAAAYTGPSLEELPAMVGEPDDGAVEDQRRSVPWGGDTPWGGSKHPMPPLRRRMMIRAMRLVFNPPDPTRRVGHGAPVLLAGREWVAVHTPGHTLDHLCLYDPEHGILLSGDHVLPSITPHIAGSARGDALRSYLATLDLVAGLDGVQLGLPAHGHPFVDVPGRVEAIKEHHAERTERLRDASLALGPVGVVELSHELFPRKHWGVMAESETFAHVEHLVRAGEAERWSEGDRLVYRVAPAQ
jgi:glyoxylase-like metal-dependent hydrolase (beta-lactamase superfamily II)